MTAGWDPRWGDDPAPGDVGDLQALARSWGDVARQLGALASSVTAIPGAYTWGGLAARSFEHQLAMLGRKLVLASDAFAQASMAATIYSWELHAAQRDAAAIVASSPGLTGVETSGAAHAQQQAVRRVSEQVAASLDQLRGNLTAAEERAPHSRSVFDRFVTFSVAAVEKVADPCGWLVSQAIPVVRAPAEFIFGESAPGTPAAGAG